MMRQMRENTKWIMLVTALAFVGLMVFQWGMDITGQSGLSIGEIGSVNGTPVPGVDVVELTSSEQISTWWDGMGFMRWPLALCLFVGLFAVGRYFTTRPSEIYYENGQLQSRSSYKAGELDGPGE